MIGSAKPFIKNPIQEILKKSKNQSEIAASEYETTSEEAKFCSNTDFSLCLKIRVNKFNAA